MSSFSMRDSIMLGKVTRGMDPPIDLWWEDEDICAHDYESP